MAELLDAEIPSAVQAALRTAGSKLTFGPSVTPPVVHEAVALDTPDDDPPMFVPEAPAPVVPQRQPWEEPLTAVTQQLQGFATKDDMQTLADRLAAQQRETLAAIVAALKPEPTTPQTPPQPRVSLVDASRKAYVEGDFTEVEAWERDQQAREAAQRAERERQTTQQTLITNLATHYPFLREMDGWNAMVGEYQKVVTDPMTALTIQADPRYVVELGGQQVDLRIARMAADIVKTRREAAQAATREREAEAAAAQTAQADTQRATRPTVEGGTTPQQRPATQPQYFLPRGMVRGNDPLLARPEVQRALAANGLGTTPKEQAIAIAKRLPSRTRDALETLHRRGLGHEVGTL